MSRVSRNDKNHPLPSEDQSPLDLAFSIFVQRAKSENRSYFGDTVRDNLGTCLSNGMTPEGAVDALMKQAPL